MIDIVTDAFGLGDKMEIKNSVVIPLDATLSRRTSYEADVTESPVESGANVSDNINLRPVVVDIVGFVTDDPISIIGNAKDLMSGNVGGALGGALGNELKTKSCYDALKEIFQGKHRCTISYRFDTFSDMVMTALSIPEEPRRGREIRFEATFKQISVAYLDLADAILIEGKKKSKGMLDKGKNAVKSAAGTVTEKKSSVLFDGLQGVGLIK